MCRTLKTVDELVQKIEFDGPTENITSKNLALGISALNYSKFNGTSFSAFIHPNTTDLQVLTKQLGSVLYTRAIETSVLSAALYCTGRVVLYMQGLFITYILAKMRAEVIVSFTVNVP